MNHPNPWHMALMCGIPLAIIVFLPLFGVSGGWVLFAAFGGMIASHLLMEGHSHEKGKKSRQIHH